jgi:hypothetical protein
MRLGRSLPARVPLGRVVCVRVRVRVRVDDRMTVTPVMWHVRSRVCNSCDMVCACRCLCLPSLCSSLCPSWTTRASSSSKPTPWSTTSSRR